MIYRTVDSSYQHYRTGPDAALQTQESVLNFIFSLSNRVKSRLCLVFSQVPLAASKKRLGVGIVSEVVHQIVLTGWLRYPYCFVYIPIGCVSLWIHLPCICFIPTFFLPVLFVFFRTTCFQNQLQPNLFRLDIVPFPCDARAALLYKI